VKIDFPCTAIVCAVAIAATACALAIPAAAVALRSNVLSGPFVHATWGHLVRDLALVAIAGVAYEAPLARVRLPLFAAGLVLPAAAVLLFTDARWYCGLSGLSHALLAAALAYEIRRRRSRLALLVGALLALKVGYELVTGGAAFPMELGANVHQVPLAHAVGVLAGIAIPQGTE